MNIRNNLLDIWTVFWRDWVVLRRRMTKFILSRMVAPMLYLVAFGWGLGRSIDVGAGSYLDFLVPGILALNSMNISFNSITPVHAERIYHKSLEEYIIAPIWPDAFLIGKVLAAVLRALISSAIIVVLALLFGAHFSMTPLFLLVLVLNCIVFAEIGFLAAMKISTYEEMAQVNTYILLPMSFLCGTFFSTQTLPAVVRCFIELLPLTHTSYLLRGLGSGAEVSMLSLLVLFAYAFIGLIWGSRAFRRLTEQSIYNRKERILFKTILHHHASSCTDCTKLCCTKIEDFSVKIGRLTIFDHVNIHIHCGQLTALIGPNGAGKSTLLKAILGEVPHTGKLHYVDAKGKHTGHPVIGYVPQYLRFDVSSPTSVMDIFMACLTRRPVWLCSAKSLRPRVLKSLERVRAAHLIDRRLGALSGGELQRVLLALALDPMPDLLLLDEPVSGVDQNGLELFYEIVADLREKEDMAIILISHDLNMVAKHADQVVLMNKGVVMSGTPEEVFADKRTKKIFGMLAGESAVEAAADIPAGHEETEEAASEEGGKC